MRLRFSEDLLQQHPKEDLELEFETLDERLQTVYLALCCLTWSMFGKILIITSMYRPTGNHASRRMLDFDVDELRQYGGLTPEETKVLVDLIAIVLFYDVTRPHFPVAVYGTIDSSGKHWDHVHLQVCASRKTKFRRNDLEPRWLELASREASTT